MKASLSVMRLSQNKPTDKREHMNVHIAYTSYYVPYMHTYSTQILLEYVCLLHIYHTYLMCIAR